MFGLDIHPYTYHHMWCGSEPVPAGQPSLMCLALATVYSSWPFPSQAVMGGWWGQGWEQWAGQAGTGQVGQVLPTRRATPFSYLCPSHCCPAYLPKLQRHSLCICAPIVLVPLFFFPHLLFWCSSFLPPWNWLWVNPTIPIFVGHLHSYHSLTWSILGSLNLPCTI